jgi:catechol 2,3-dioxygenase-like lactoylglutathione lyase family enzyme
MRLEVVGTAGTNAERAWTHTDVPAEHAIRGFHHAELWEARADAPAATLELLGFKQVGVEGMRVRYATGGGGASEIVDVSVRPAGYGGSGVGTVHHIAWRVADDAGQAAWLEAVGKAGLGVSPVMDREYFHSIYFREPGGVLFEIATDGPGFAINQPVSELGSKLVLPAWLEKARAEIERVLPKVVFPAPVVDAEK